MKEKFSVLNQLKMRYFAKEFATNNQNHDKKHIFPHLPLDIYHENLCMGFLGASTHQSHGGFYFAA